VLLLGIVHNKLQSYGLLILFTILLEFRVLLYSSKPTCKSAINKIAGTLSSDIINKITIKRKWRNINPGKYPS
jgi:predicted transcriptional regulator